MTEKSIEYVIRLAIDDRYRHRHSHEKGKILFFSIQYETRIHDAWHPVVRYDTAHGFAHRDLFTMSGTIEKTPIFNQDFNSSLTFAENDLRTNWKWYKKRFQGEDNE